MKLFYQEAEAHYQSYCFPYTIWAEREHNESIDALYKAGFLPYSSNQAVRGNYYMARSVRVALDAFSLSSENRRVKRKFTDTMRVNEVDVFAYRNNAFFIEFCLRYFKIRHGDNVFTRDRLLAILAFSPEVRLYEYTWEGAVVAYVIECHGQAMRHFWFSFYDIDLSLKSFGVFLMLDSLERAKTAGSRFMYLGTAYGEKALYKTNFLPLEFWDGNRWVEDIKALKALARQDRPNT